MNISKNFFKNKLNLFLFSIFISLLLVEILLRFMKLGYLNAPLDLDQIVHHKHPKNLEFVIYDPFNEYGPHLVNYDVNGLRVNTEKKGKINNKNKIAFIGDSFTEANQVDFKHSFVGLLEESYKNTLFKNYGVSSYSPLIYLLLTNNELSIFRPNIVILQLYFNDFDDDHFYLKKADSTDLNLIKSIQPENKFFFYALFRHSYLVRFTKKIIIQIKHLNEPKKKYNSNKDVFADTIKNNRELTYKTILQIKNNLEKMDAELYLFIIPEKNITKKNTCCVEDWLHEEVKIFAEYNRINFIDLGKTFSQYYNQDQIFFDKDIHLTKVGHQLIAKELDSVLNYKLNYRN